MNLDVYYLYEDSCAATDQLSEKLATYPKHHLSNDSWPQIATDCITDFVIAHSGQEILIKFTTAHDYFRAIERPVNGAVHLDNCVEFFIAFDQSGYYYNIEFNCLGVGKVGYGKGKLGRTLLQESIIQKIQTVTTANDRHGDFNWEMILRIPVDTFVYHQIESLEGLMARANFYKCGDELPNPHFLCWNKIVSPLPDFHRPDHFGTLQFMPAKEISGSFNP
ncbi:carbohydrate-binding family 9-like protein [Pedobacter sp. MC2016-24]|uniref:carbohydrate-binding family 9-like protein n=1 Tax=Pedobacter sp. MC2016-24 TaxID=2780090 RepID=UPI00188212E9|nr:carbohydrate-binding family 9-like protein [Pedobacter sp. MC2016-24]MBE9601142.1 hypothetical protein [Pedobacter sp. MC2016-24]